MSLALVFSFLQTQPPGQSEPGQGWWQQISIKTQHRDIVSGDTQGLNSLQSHSQLVNCCLIKGNPPNMPMYQFKNEWLN